MAFVCPTCKKNTLDITRAVDVEPDQNNDEARAQLLACTSCDFRGIGYYEESRRGALDSDHARHTGYIVSAEQYKQLEQDMDTDAVRNDIHTYTDGPFAWDDSRQFSMQYVQ